MFSPPHRGAQGDMIGCLLILPITGAIALMGVYMSTLMGYLAVVATAMGIYMSGLAAYFTALLFWILG